jgi:hypothetical protein
MPKEYPIETHTSHDGACRSFLVLVSDKTIKALNYGHPFRALQTVFNGGGRQSSRLAALAEALRAAEDDGIAYPGLRAHFVGWVKAQFLRIRPRHADDILVDRFAKALKQKLAAARAKGRSGWEAGHWMDEARGMLVEHVIKGDPRDVANFCAFLWHHGEGTETAFDDFNRVRVSKPADRRITKIVHRKSAPKIVCLIGTHNADAVIRAETVGHVIVLHTDITKTLLHAPPAMRPMVADSVAMLHKRKIELADEVLVLDGDTVTARMRGEIEYAKQHGKLVRWASGKGAR